MHYTTLPLLLCGCKIWFFALRKEHKLWVPNRKMPTAQINLRGKEGWKKNCLCIMGGFMICDRQILAGLIKSSETAVQVACMGKRGNAYRVSVEKRERNWLLRSGRGWEDILKHILKTGLVGCRLDSSGSRKGPWPSLLKTLICKRVPQNARNFLSIQLLATREGLCSAELAIHEIITNDYYDLGSTRKRIIQTFARKRCIFTRQIPQQIGPKSAKPLHWLWSPEMCQVCTLTVIYGYWRGEVLSLASRPHRSCTEVSGSEGKAIQICSQHLTSNLHRRQERVKLYAYAYAFTVRWLYVTPTDFVLK
jgi:hypothetical protein